jgi:hypothetical protein
MQSRKAIFLASALTLLPVAAAAGAQETHTYVPHPQLGTVRMKHTYNYVRHPRLGTLRMEHTYVPHPHLGAVRIKSTAHRAK